MPPEAINENSPLIRDQHSRKIKSVSTTCIGRLIHQLYIKAGLIDITKRKRRYRLRPHSIRKYFRTKLGSLGTISPEYIKYMMGNVISTYNDIPSMGIDFLRNKYAMTGLCIRQKEKSDIYDFIEDVLRSKGYRTDKELLRKAIMTPHRTVCSPVNYEEERRTDIRDAFMEMMRKEFLDSSLENKNQMLDI